MNGKEICKWLMMGLQWGTGFYIFSIAGLYLATEWGRSPLFAMRATVLGFVLYILIALILVLLAAFWKAGREKKGLGQRGFLPHPLLGWVEPSHFNRRVRSLSPVPLHCRGNPRGQAAWPRRSELGGRVAHRSGSQPSEGHSDHSNGPG